MADRTSTAKPFDVLVRIRQGIAALNPVVPVHREITIATWLDDRQAAAFQTLPAYDQHHLCRVAGIIRARGVTDHDLLAAALLHDIAKSGTPGYPGRVRLIHRALNVILRRIAPSLLMRLAETPAPGWRRGLSLAVHHARLGANYAAELDCSARTCWLIGHHDANPIPNDADLTLLIEADHLAQ